LRESRRWWYGVYEKEWCGYVCENATEGKEKKERWIEREKEREREREREREWVKRIILERGSRESCKRT